VRLEVTKQGPVRVELVVGVARRPLSDR